MRTALLLAALVLAAGGWLTTLRLYEEGAALALRGAPRPFRRERLAALAGAWARESGLLFLATLARLLSLFPRGRLKQGAWLAAPEEVRHGAPVLLVPGLLGGRLSLETLRRRLEASGRPALAIDLPPRAALPLLEEAVEAGAEELAKACETQTVDLVAFGAGGIAARRFAQGKGLSRVERCVVLGAGPTRLAAFFPGALAPDLVPGSAVAALLAAPPPEGTRITSVRGADDAVVLPPGGDAVARPGVDFRLEGHGHFALLGSEKAWRAVKAALRRGGEEEREESTQEAALRAMAELSR